MNTTIRRPFMKIAAALLVIGGMLMPMTTVASSSQPRDFDMNSIIWGGCYSKSECVDNFDHGDYHGHSAANLQQIYFNEGRGISRANFMNTVDGTVYKDGRVVVNGQVVATNAYSIGRDYINGSGRSGSAWERPTNVSFVANSIPAFVNMDGGTFHYFIIKSCGNAGRAIPVPPPAPPVPPVVPPAPPVPPVPPIVPPISFRCVDLLPTQPDKTKPNFRFTIMPEVSANVTITGYRFTFSDNKVVDTNAGTPFVERTFVAGSYKVKGQVKTTAGISEISEVCGATINVTQDIPAPTPPGKVLGTSLPATGPEAALGGIAGLSAIAYSSRAYLRSRKNLVDALRNKKSK